MEGDIVRDTLHAVEQAIGKACPDNCARQRQQQPLGRHGQCHRSSAKAQRAHRGDLARARHYRGIKNVYRRQKRTKVEHRLTP